MKTINLTQNQVAQVDDEDYNFLIQWEWHCEKHGNTYRAKRSLIKGDKCKITLMHRMILNAEKNQEIDHKDRNGLNNQKSNLRFCNHSQNCSNRKKEMNHVSKYKGVTWEGKKKLWRAQIVFNHKHFGLGRFKLEEKAAMAYNIKAKELFGNFAVLNFADNIDEYKDLMQQTINF